MSTNSSDDSLLLEQAYGRETACADEVYLVQPLGGGKVESYTWKRTMDEARRVASYLKAQNWPPQSKVGFISKNCAQFFMTELAIWMAGHVSVAPFPTLSADAVRYILEHSEAKMLFVGKLDTWDELKKGVPEDLPLVAYPLAPENDYKSWDEIIAEHEPLEGNPLPDPEDLSMIMYTSGSTGEPKGVMHTHRSIAAAANNAKRALELTDEERCLSYLPLAHAFERAVVFCGSLVAGGTVYFAESLDTFVADLQRARPTLFQSVPRLWLKFQAGVHQKLPPKKLKRLLKIPILGNIVRKKVLTGLGLQHTRLALSGSAPIPPELIHWYQDLGLELLEGYGMTENFAYSHFSKPGRARVGYVGEVQIGVECKLSEEGEILVKSPADMKGYFKRPEETKEAFTEDGFLKTGDRGEVDKMGRLRITGRTKELFKTSKGKYIAPAPIENIINNHEHIELSCVSGSGQPTAYGLLMLSEDLYPKLSDAALRERLEDELSGLLSEVNAKVEGFEKLGFFAVSSRPWTIEEGLLTPTMKIKRGNLEDAFNPFLDQWYESGKKVIWQED